MEGYQDGVMLLRREDEVRGKRIHPLGDIMRGSSCLLLGQTTHRCEGASGPDRAEGGTLESLCHDLTLRTRAPTITSTTPCNAKPSTG